jgi:hypothetical protein
VKRPETCDGPAPLRHMPRPCDASDTSGPCPFRRDAPPGEFTAERFEQLAASAGAPGAEVPLGGIMFACHSTADGAQVACAGWLAVCGTDHLGVRFAASDGRLGPDAVRPQPGWPDLFDSYDEMATTQTLGAYDPETAEAFRDAAGHYADVITKLTRRAVR